MHQWLVEKQIAEKVIHRWENHDRHRVADGDYSLFENGKEPNDVAMARALIEAVNHSEQEILDLKALLGDVLKNDEYLEGVNEANLGHGCELKGCG